MVRTNALAIRSARRLWMLHSWSEVENVPSNTLKDKAMQWLRTQWQSIDESPEGSWRSYLRKAAHFILDRQDPQEAFLAGLPPQSRVVMMAYPEGEREEELQSHMKEIAQRSYSSQRRRFYTNGAIMLPFLPLALSPLPNAPLYYVWYRMYCNHRASAGAKLLSSMMQSPFSFGADGECTRHHLLESSQSDDTKSAHTSVCCRLDHVDVGQLSGALFVPCRALKRVDEGDGLATPAEGGLKDKMGVSSDDAFTVEQIDALERVTGASGVDAAAVRMKHAEQRRQGKADLISRLFGG